MDGFRIRGHGRHGIEHCREFFVFHMDQVQSRQGGFLVHGCHAGHFIADVSHLFRLDELLVPCIGKYPPISPLRCPRP